MERERTKEDREHVDPDTSRKEELTELMPDEARAIDRAEKTRVSSPSKKKPNLRGNSRGGRKKGD